MPVRIRNDYPDFQTYMNAPETRARHNGYGYDDLLKNYKKGPAFIRDLFGIGGPSKSRDKAIRLIKQIKEEIGE